MSTRLSPSRAVSRTCTIYLYSPWSTDFPHVGSRAALLFSLSERRTFEGVDYTLYVMIDLDLYAVVSAAE